MQSESVTVRLPSALVEEIRHLAEAETRTLAKQFEKTLKDGLKKI